MYVAAHTLLITWLRAAFPSVRVGTETPANLANVLPYIRVSRFGGGDDTITIDAAHVDIDCYATDITDPYNAASTLAEQVRDSLRFNLPGQTVAGGTVAGVSTISAPSWAPYDNTTLRRFVASYRVIIHSHL